ncbi:hypothetical protein CEXT_69251 [Caerostris extrusa]|uniref:Uncharacterized protein n=1 Tax=Caerostris extrusa TaxID=172846 RepID=A0AAV4MDI0_CAEEX|nr:hypothetical protein CEXT_69251 [Caerostris extrusa]
MRYGDKQRFNSNYPKSLTKFVSKALKLIYFPSNLRQTSRNEYDSNAINWCHIKTKPIPHFLPTLKYKSFATQFLLIQIRALNPGLMSADGRSKSRSPTNCLLGNCIARLNNSEKLFFTLAFQSWGPSALLEEFGYTGSETSVNRFYYGPA